MLCVLNEAILMRTDNIPLSIYKRKSSEMIQNIIMSEAMGFFFLGTEECSK